MLDGLFVVLDRLLVLSGSRVVVGERVEHERVVGFEVQELDDLFAGGHGNTIHGLGESSRVGE